MNNPKSVYIYPARRNGKSMACIRMIAELMDAGHNVVPIYRTPRQNLRGRVLSDVIIDKDILTLEQMERAERILNEIRQSDGKQVV